MKNKYADLIDQTFFFPTEEFETNEAGQLQYWGIDLMKLVEKYGSPFRFSYLPKISENIQKAKTWFADAFERNNYKGNYNYCYCTKSSHYKYVLEEALKNDVHIETSSAFDLDIILKLEKDGLIDKSKYIICNGFKTNLYVDKIIQLIEMGFDNLYVILDNTRELDLIKDRTDKTIKIGIRIAAEEEPKFEFYTSRLGIGYRFIVPFYEEKIKDLPNVQLKMLHFFINTGIRDTAYYWNELHKCLSVYTKLKGACATLDSLNIGGGFPIKRNLNFTYDYAYMIQEIVSQIKSECDSNNIPEPHLFTEFGSFTVGESGGTIFKVIHQKRQNDREKWNMIDGSFMTTLPDAWAISDRFILLPLNHWNEKYERILLGGLTCDSDDYYNSEQHVNAIYMPTFNPEDPLYIGFFNTGAYQETLSGQGGLKHCLIPSPKKILLWKDEEGNLQDELYCEEQSPESMLNILGY
ncbi:arginine decarboxylase [bacterium]|nr:arginine decarboxylase [bacterium]